LLCSGGNNDVALGLGILNSVKNEYVHYSINVFKYNINLCVCDYINSSSFSDSMVTWNSLTPLNAVEFCYDEFLIEESLYANKEEVLEIKFLTYTSSSTVVEFISLQDNIYLHSDETGLCFFRVYNPTEYDVSVLSIYFPYPSEVSLFVGKIQCFCFDLLKCNSYESVELPVLFYLEKEVVDILKGKD
jgi:Cytochrome c oxidase assembly protein CtaG/Cox11